MAVIEKESGDKTEDEIMNTVSNIENDVFHLIAKHYNGQPRQAILRLVESIHRTNRNATSDNCFLSIDIMEELKNNRHSQFKEVTTIENVYNRCIIYDAHAWHRANNYFGKTIGDVSALCKSWLCSCLLAYSDYHLARVISLSFTA